MASIFDADPLVDGPAPPPAAAAPPAGAGGPADIYAGDQLLEPAAVPVQGPPAPAHEGGGLTESLARGATFGLSDLAAAAGAATGGYLAGKPGGWGEQYEQHRAERRRGAEEYAAEHPWLSAGASLVGTLSGAAPIARAAEGALALPTLGRQVATGAGLGATTGGIEAGASSDEPAFSPGMGWDIAKGVGAGGAVGALAPVGGALAGRLVSPLARALSDQAVENQALRVIDGRISQDAAAGGPGIGDIGNALEMAPFGKPLTPADVGGANVTGLVGRIGRAPGESRQITKAFLDQRDAEAGNRLLDDVRDLMSSGKSAFSTSQDLIAARQAASAPAYQAAIYDAAGNPRLVADPAIDQLVSQSGWLRNAINSARANLPELANAPNSDMRLLDQAYKSIGGRANAAQVSGDSVLAHNLNQVRGDFLNRLKAVNPEYERALAEFSGPSDSMRAVELGQGVFNRSADETRQLLQGLPKADQDFFRLGAADALRTSINRTGVSTGTGGGGNEARAIIGNRLRQEQLRPLFDTDEAFQNFIGRAESESRMFDTRFAALGGAQTAGRLAEDVGTAGGGALTPLVTGIGALTAGEPVLAGTQLATGLKRLANVPEVTHPAVNAAVARRLFDPEFLGQQQTLADLLALRPPAGSRLSAPAGALAGALATGGGLDQAIRWGTGLPSVVRGGQPQPAQ